MTSWTDEIHKWTVDYARTQDRLGITRLIHGGRVWPDRWIPYFGGDPTKEVIDNPDWKNNVVKEPYTLHFISTGKWWVDVSWGTTWMASFDPAYKVETKITKWRKEIHGVAPDVKVDIRSVLDYAEDKHKDDVAILKKKWKYL